MAVAIGDYDASAVCANFPLENRHSKLVGKLRVLAYTDPAPGWLFTIRKDFPEKDKKKLIKALLNLSPGSKVGKKVLLRSPWLGFVRPSGDELTKIKLIIQQYNIPQAL